MTPEEEYRFDVRGYLVVEKAIEPDYLAHLNERLGFWEEKARRELADKPEKKIKRGPNIGFFNLLNEEPSMLALVANPVILPYVDALVKSPILEQFCANFRWQLAAVLAAPAGLPGYHTKARIALQHSSNSLEAVKPTWPTECESRRWHLWLRRTSAIFHPTVRSHKALTTYGCQTGHPDPRMDLVPLSNSIRRRTLR